MVLSIETFTVIQSTFAMVDQLAAVQRACFPTIAENELMTAEHYAAHIERFSAGQMAIVDAAGQVVACSTDFRTTVDFEHYDHRYIEIVDNNWLGNHDPDGDWLYGADIGVAPPYRGKKLSTRLYEARHGLVRQLNLRGHVAGGMLSGYGNYKNEMPVEAYVERIISGDLFDPTVSIQLRRGFHVHGILRNYVDDPICDNAAVFLVWHNPDYTRITESSLPELLGT